MQAIVRWPSMIVTTCSVIPTLGLRSIFGCNAVYVACVCRTASVLKFIGRFIRFYEVVV